MWIIEYCLTKGLKSYFNYELICIKLMFRGDDGEYTCKPASGGEAKVRLHVVRGDIIG